MGLRAPLPMEGFKIVALAAVTYKPRDNDPCPQIELTEGEHLNSTIGTLYPL